jgi:hypothetical protein
MLAEWLLMHTLDCKPYIATQLGDLTLIQLNGTYKRWHTPSALRCSE